jgi:hypothetical protein
MGVLCTCAPGEPSNPPLEPMIRLLRNDSIFGNGSAA